MRKHRIVGMFESKDADTRFVLVIGNYEDAACQVYSVTKDHKLVPTKWKFEGRLGAESRSGGEHAGLRGREESGAVRVAEAGDSRTGRKSDGNEVVRQVEVVVEL